MKRAILVLTFLVILSLTMSMALAGDTRLPPLDLMSFGQQSSGVPCTELNVCGSTPNSRMGFGAVELCGQCAVCGVADGVCPEDFISDNLQGSCASCPDPECTGRIYGYVNESPFGNSLANVNITVRYPHGEWEELAETNTDGQYTELAMAADPIEMKAHYTDYDTEEVEYYVSPIQTISLERGEEKEVNFTLRKAACMPDCTRNGTNFCDKTCQGENGCVFANKAGVITSEDSKEILDGQQIGDYTELLVDHNCTTGIQKTYSTMQCENPIKENIAINPCGTGCEEPPCEPGGDPFQLSIQDGDGSKTNLITKTVRVYMENGESAILTIVYWEGEE